MRDGRWGGGRTGKEEAQSLARPSLGDSYDIPSGESRGP